MIMPSFSIRIPSCYKLRYYPYRMSMLSNLFNFIIIFIELTFLGLLVAFNPLLLVSELAIILKSKRPLLNAIVLIAGIATPLVLLAIVGGLIFDESTEIRTFNINIHLSPLLNIVIGFILVLIGLRLQFFPKPAKTKRLQAHQLSLGSLYGFAFFRSALSFSSIIGIITATKIIKDATDNYIVVLLGLFWTISIGMIPFLGMIGFSMKRPDSIKSLESRIDPLMNRSYKPVAIWGCILLGSYLIVIGISSTINL